VIMDRQAAERIVPALVRAAADIAATTEIVEAHAPADRSKAYSDAVGRVIFEIDGVLRPIITEYPDLHP
jgi:hypothetical protein